MPDENDERTMRRDNQRERERAARRPGTRRRVHPHESVKKVGGGYAMERGDPPMLMKTHRDTKTHRHARAHEDTKHKRTDTPVRR